jgi:dihydroorotase
MKSQLFKQVRILDPVSKSDRLADLLIVDGYIRAIEDNIYDYPAETEIKDCQGLILGPGLVDCASHSGEPGFEERETLKSLMHAAAAGGFTRLAILPDTAPPIDNPAGLAGLKMLAASASSPSLYFWGALTKGIRGEQMTELGELAAAGVVGFADGRPLANFALLRRLLEYVKPLNKPVALVASDRLLAGNGVMREGYDSIRLGLPGIPAAAESGYLAALLELVDAIGTPVRILGVSTARSVELIRDAKHRGLPVSASTSWMHLLLDTEAIEGRDGIPFDPNLRLEPPLGTKSDRLALVRGVKEGVLEAIAIDHTPFTYEEKTVAFADAPPGAIGLELALPLLWQGLVESGELSGLELWRALSSGPAGCLGLSLGAIAPNLPAEVILFDPQQTWTVSKQTIKSLSANTPWWGREIKGRVVCIN